MSNKWTIFFIWGLYGTFRSDNIFGPGYLVRWMLGGEGSELLMPYWLQQFVEKSAIFALNTTCGHFRK